jgi:hypothetical protein
MPIVITVVVAVVLLVFAFWVKSIDPSKDATAAAATGSLAIHEILQTVDTKSLAVEEFEDHTFVFSTPINRAEDNHRLSTAVARR